MKLKMLIAALPLVIGTIACNNSTSTTERTDSTTATLERTGENIKDAASDAAKDVKEAADTAMTRMRNAVNGDPDSAFVARASILNQHEIKLLQAGSKMGTNKQLKDHAKMMLTDHNALAKKMSAFAAAKHYPKADEKVADDMDDLKGKTGADWDKAWLNKMVDGHEDAIKTFENARNDVKDSELKALIDNTLPTLRHHLDMVTSLRDGMK